MNVRMFLSAIVFMFMVSIIVNVCMFVNRHFVDMVMLMLLIH